MLNDLAQEIYNNAVSHGWWDKEREFPEIIALCHSELSEALEEYRNGKPFYYEKAEMVDCIIRILDWAGHEDLDIEGIMKWKMEYNKNRPYRHGGKVI